MSHLNPAKLHVRRMGTTRDDGPLLPRSYTLTHSDRTGELFLTIGPEVDRRQISGWYTRLMRDEVIAEWVRGEQGPELHVHCHVSGGLVLGSASWREAILRRHLPEVLETFRFGDRALFEARPELDLAPIWVFFHTKGLDQDRRERWGTPGDYRPSHDPPTEDPR